MARMARELGVGGIVGAYRIEGLLGQGGMGAVYLAEHVHLKRRVALKVLATSLADDPEFRDRFIRESQLAASIDHPNVMPVYDANDDDGVLYLAMRYVEGSDLKARLGLEGKLSPEGALAILEQAALGLDAAHARGLVHRDIKPANVMIEAGTGHVYVTDFGIAKLVAGLGITRTGSFLGTIEYASPEQFEGRALDGRSDVYSFGCMLFHCLAGQPPYVRDSEVAVMHAHLTEPPPALTGVRPDLSPAFDAIVAKAMAKRPEDRYPTAGAVAHALRDAVERPDESPAIASVLAPTEARTVAAEPAPDVRPARAGTLSHRRRWLYAAAALGIAGAGIAVALVATGGGGGKSAGDRGTSAGKLLPNTPLRLSVQPTGQKATATFAGKEGTRVLLRWSKNTIGSWTTVTVLSPTGSQVFSDGFSADSGELDPQTLPATGTYKVQLDQEGSSAGNVTLGLSIVPADVRGLLRADKPVRFEVRAVGQKAVGSFTGKARQRVLVSWSNNTLAGWTTVTLLSPTGSQVLSDGFSADSGELDPQTLPSSGTYQLQLDPNGTSIGSVVLTRTVVPPDVKGNLRPGGSLPVTITAAGQEAIVHFAGKAGQRVLVGWGKNTINGWTTVTLLSPTGSQVVQDGFSSDRGEFDPQTLPSSGAYELKIDPDGANTGSLVLTFGIVPPDTHGQLSPGGSSTVTIKAAGQKAVLGFSGKAGRRAVLSFAGNTLAGWTSVTLLSADGTQIVQSGFSGDSGVVDPLTLPATGRYQLQLDPDGASTGTVRLTLTLAPATG